MAAEKPTGVKFVFNRSNSYRAVHCDFAWGSITPQNALTLFIMSETYPHPISLTQDFTKEGSNALEERKGPKGHAVIEREVEVGLIMTPEVALNIANILSHFAKISGQAVEQSEGSGS